MARHILIVDQDLRFVEAVRARMPEIDIHSASTPEDGLCRILSNRYDVVIADLSPGMGGVALLKTLRWRYSEPVLFFGIGGTDDRRFAAFQEGASGFIKKPLVLETFVPSLKLLLARTPVPRPMYPPLRTETLT